MSKLQNNRVGILALLTILISAIILFSLSYTPTEPQTDGTDPPENTWRILITQTTGGYAVPNGAKNLECGQTLTVTAYPQVNYAFSHWTFDSTTYTSNPITVPSQQSKSSHTLTAVFEVIPNDGSNGGGDNGGGGTGTGFFSSGFEVANFGDWSQADGPLTRSTVRVHHGSYSMLCDGTDYEYVYNDYPQTFDTLYLRFYIWFDGVPAGDVHLACINDFYTSETYRNDYHLMLTEGKWALLRPPWSEGHVTVASTGPTPYTWICVELMCTRSGSTISAELWVDEASVSTNSYDSGRTYNFGQVHLGGWGKSHSSTFYIDCAVISTSYIGGE
jgi:hypothetical protein